MPSPVPGFTDGELRTVLAQMARDAIAYHYDGQCGDPEHTFMTEQYERFLDRLDPQPILAAVPPS